MINEGKKQFIARQLTSLKKVHELYKEFKDIDASLSQLYPITIVEDNTFFVFDLDITGEKYEFKLEYPAPMQIPKGILASFSLDFYNTKPSAIVSDNVFEGPEGYIFIFHEFVHCYQWENIEKEIRASLEIERKSKEENNFMWEITHPFPYEEGFFIEKTIELDSYLNTKNYNGILDYHKQMSEYLSRVDFEYMIWQEWKEGYARFIENILRDRIGINRNTNKLQIPFDRVCFYEIGSKYLELLLEIDTDLKSNIKELYYKMATYGYIVE